MLTKYPRWKVRLWCATPLVVNLGAPSVAIAQTDALHSLVGAGVFVQTAPGHFSELGVAIHAALYFPVGRGVILTPEIELSSAFRSGTEDVCYYGDDPDGPCLKRPSQESVLSMGAGLRLKPGCTAGVCPYFALGGMLSRSLAKRLSALEARTFTDPTASIGFGRAGQQGRWNVEARWRRLARWDGPQKRTSQYLVRVSRQM